VSSLATPTITHPSFLGARGELHSNRPLYPYSVIPGGVETAGELRRAVANDPVVAAHYAGFDIDHAHIVRLVEARFAFVSYRKRGNVFWTSKRLRLPVGETLITDGIHSARTRCANQISDTPRSPIAPDGEPTPKTLTTPVLTWDIEQPPIDLPLESPPVTGTLPLVGGGGGGIPSGGPIFVGGGGGSGGNAPGGTIFGGGGGGNPPSPNPLSPVPFSTPEPGTLLLTATGLCAAWLARKLRKS
jgi:hypothetical protein